LAARHIPASGPVSKPSPRPDTSKLSTLQTETFFGRLDEAALRELVPGGVVRTFAKNVVVINEGEATDSLYVVLSGRVKVFVNGEEGKEVVVDTVGPGHYFGEMVLDGGPRSASIMTLEPSRFFVITLADVERLLESNPAFARNLIRLLIAKVRSLTAKITDLVLRDNYGRFVRYVEDHAVEQDGQLVIPEKLTQHDIAARIGGSREMVSRILKDLVAGGYLSVKGRILVIEKKLPAKW
jgi:CRP/FNR family cyclic AMP-dependent transcriptional regulator